jgi:hypothetical protein
MTAPDHLSTLRPRRPSKLIAAHLAREGPFALIGPSRGRYIDDRRLLTGEPARGASDSTVDPLACSETPAQAGGRCGSRGAATVFSSVGGVTSCEWWDGRSRCARGAQPYLGVGRPSVRPLREPEFGLAGSWRARSASGMGRRVGCRARAPARDSSDVRTRVPLCAPKAPRRRGRRRLLDLLAHRLADRAEAAGRDAGEHPVPHRPRRRVGVSEVLGGRDRQLPPVVR